MSRAGAAEPGRLVTLDGLRGIAVMGILLMNVNAFAMPFPAYDNPANYGPMHWPDVALWAIEFVFVDGKLRAIFSALFGASLLLVADRAEAAGRSPVRTSLARLLVLLLFGIAHACLVWAGDILVLYALVGLAALPLRRLPIERLLVLAGLMMALQAAILGLHYQALFALEHAVQAPAPTPAALGAWRQVLAIYGRPAGEALIEAMRLHRGGWPALAASLSADAPGTTIVELIFTGPETLGLMLLGMAGLKSGLLGGGWSPRVAIRLARWAYLLGLPPLAGIAGWVIAMRFPPLDTAMLTDLAAMPLRWAVAIGHVAMLVPWLARSAGGLGPRLAAVGRVAFSNYLGTSIAMTALFEGWGLGLYGRMERWTLLPIVLLAWAAMLAWSPAWLARFRYGPLEWAWRSLSRARPAPMRRIAIANRLHSQ